MEPAGWLAWPLRWHGYVGHPGEFLDRDAGPPHEPGEIDRRVDVEPTGEHGAVMLHGARTCSSRSSA